MTTWTMSEARQRFRELLDRAGSGQPIRITRHGEVTAVVVAPRDFERLRIEAGAFAEALRRFRATTDVADLPGDELEGLRDPAPGRPVTL
ncbi:hypothetical protein BH20ACT9_BH20ACT9_16930 [soil metagenome]